MWPFFEPFTHINIVHILIGLSVLYCVKTIEEAITDGFDKVADRLEDIREVMTPGDDTL